MGNSFLLKIVTDTNKRFILSLEPSYTTNKLIKQIKKYYMHYFKHKYYIEYIYTSDKFIIFDDLPLENYFNSSDICYIKGQEESDFSSVDLENRVKYDTFLRKNKTECYDDNKRFKNNNPNILKDNKNNILKDNKSNILKDNKSNIIKDSKNNIIKANNSNLLRDNNLNLIRDNNPNILRDNKNNIIKDNNPNLLRDNNPNILKDNKNNNIIKNAVRINRRKSKDNILQDKENGVIESPNKLDKRKNNKNERNFNIKNGINPNLILKDFPSIVKEDKINLNTEKNNEILENSNKSTQTSFSNTLTDSKKEVQSQIPNKETDELFVPENVNKSKKDKIVLDIDKIKQVKRKKKINYEEL